MLCVFSSVWLFCDCMDCSPGLCVCVCACTSACTDVYKHVWRTHGISQAKILEWVAISFCRGSFWTRGWTCLLHCRRIFYRLTHQEIPFSLHSLPNECPLTLLWPSLGIRLTHLLQTTFVPLSQKRKVPQAPSPRQPSLHPCRGLSRLLSSLGVFLPHGSAEKRPHQRNGLDPGKTHTFPLISVD